MLSKVGGGNLKMMVIVMIGMASAAVIAGKEGRESGVGGLGREDTGACKEWRLRELMEEMM